MTTLIPTAVPATATPALRPIHAALTWCRRRRATTRRALADRLAAAERAAITDPLTGLLNRAGFTQHAAAILRAATENTRPVAAVFVDLDGFKQVNDTLGHHTGDSLLIGTAAALATAFPSPTAAIGRLGGDEFVILDSPTTIETEPYARTTRLLVGAFHNGLAKAVNDAFGVPVHASAGIAVVDPAVRWTPLANLLAAAESAMYTAKRGGTGIATYPATAPLPFVQPHPVVRTRDTETDTSW